MRSEESSYHGKYGVSVWVLVLSLRVCVPFYRHGACVIVTQRTAGKIALALLLWIVALMVVIAGELLPESSTPMQMIADAHISDKLLHFTAYTVLALIPTIGFSLPVGISAAALTVLLGVGLEFAQRLVPGRSFDVGDMKANALGVLLGVAAGLVIRRGLARRTPVRTGSEMR